VMIAMALAAAGYAEDRARQRARQNSSLAIGVRPFYPMN